MKKFLSFFIAFQIFSTALFAQYWSEVGGLNGLSANLPISALCSDAAGNIYTAGVFKNNSGKPYVAKYDGSSWNELGGVGLGAYPTSYITTLCSDTARNIYAAGDFSLTAVVPRSVAKYDGSTWSELGGVHPLSANTSIDVLHSDTLGNIYVAGYFKNASGKRYVAKYDGNTWSELGGVNALSANNEIIALCIDASGNIYVAGGFTNSSGKYYVAKYDGNTWSELGGVNTLSANSGIYSLCVDVSGNIYAAGFFTNSSGKRYVAKYDGSTWSELGGLNALSANSFIWSICSDVAGNIYAAGLFTNSSGKRYVAKYDGSTWSELGGLNALSADSTIQTLSTDAFGNIYAAGLFTNSSGKFYVAMFGNAWHTQTICSGDSVAFNNHYYKTQGSYFDTLTNYQGHDSIIVLRLNVIQPIIRHDTVSICYQSTYNFNGQLLSSSGIYYDTLHSQLGCDSIITILNLTKLPLNQDTIHIKICPNQYYVFNHDTLFHAGVYTDTLTAANGCDSIIVLQLKFNQPDSFQFTQTICAGNYFIFNQDTLNQSGVYQDTLQNYVGCDSIIILHLIINTSSQTNLTQSICSGSGFSFNNQFLTTSGIYYDTLQNYLGCDSIIALQLSVLPPIDTTIIFHNDTLISIAQNATFQWINCDSNKVVSTDSILLVKNSNLYLLVVKSNGCADTTNCYFVTASGITNLTNNAAKNDLKVYPNPANRTINILYKDLTVGTTIEIINCIGIVVEKLKINNSNGNLTVDVSKYADGIYLINANGIILTNNKLSIVH